MFENETQEIILKRMLDRMDASLDKREGSVSFDLVSPSSYEFYNVYQLLETILDLSFADTASDEWLDLRVAEMGIYRKPSVKAKGSVKLTGPSGILVPSGTIVSTDGENPIYFLTLNDVTTVNGEANVEVEAEIGGSFGNINPGEITHVIGDLTSVIDPSNDDYFTGGFDREDDESLRERYFQRVLRPSTSGNENHYYSWATSIAGVSDAKVDAVFYGPGTVRILLLDDDKKPASADLIQSVQTYIETERPIGATVHVESPLSVLIDLSGSLVLSSGYLLADVKAKIEDSLKVYLKNLAFNDPNVRYAKILSLILSTEGVEDCLNLTVNGGTANLVIDADKVALKGAVNLV